MVAVSVGVAPLSTVGVAVADGVAVAIACVVLEAVGVGESVNGMVACWWKCFLALP
jgi:hypothetical protein